MKKLEKVVKVCLPSSPYSGPDVRCKVTKETPGEKREGPR